MPNDLPSVKKLLTIASEFNWLSFSYTLALLCIVALIMLGLRRWFGQKTSSALLGWQKAILLLGTPMLLWLFARGMMWFYVEQGRSPLWFEFLAQWFGAWLCVRLFLYVVRRALPTGARRVVLERLAVLTLGAAFILDYLGHWQGVLHWLDQWAVRWGASRISALDALTLLISLWVLWLVVKWLSQELENALVRKPQQSLAQFDLSSRMVFLRLMQGILVLVALLLSLAAAGIDLRVLSIFGGALGVGIGLGLQKIASNYVSGFMILLERSVRLGDLISTPDNVRGFVRAINARYTLIEGTRGDEILLPNEQLVTQAITNWTLTDKKNWMSTQIPVNYDIDLDFIMAQIVNAVTQLPRVAPAPRPNVLLSSISDKGYILEITWWLVDPENGRLNILSDVNLAAWRVLRQHNVDVFTLKESNPPLHPNPPPLSEVDANC